MGFLLVGTQAHELTRARGVTMEHSMRNTACAQRASSLRRLCELVDTASQRTGSGTTYCKIIEHFIGFRPSSGCLCKGCEGCNRHGASRWLYPDANFELV